MTEYQICEDYRRAKFKAKQVYILAELNLVGKKEIVEVLKRNGLAVNLRRNDPQKGVREEMAELYRKLVADGLTCREAAAKMGVPEQRVRNYAFRHGLKFAGAKK